MNKLNAVLANLRLASDMQSAANDAAACGQLLGYSSLMIIGNDGVPFAENTDFAGMLQPYVFGISNQEIAELNRDAILHATYGDVDISAFSTDALLLVPAVDVTGNPLIVVWCGCSGNPAAHAILHSVSIQISALVDLGDVSLELKQSHIDYLSAVCAGASDQDYSAKTGVSIRTISRMRQTIKRVYGLPTFEQVVAMTAKTTILSKKNRKK